jgi:hypothetical protein
MNEQALQIAWMRAVLRLHARADVATWSDEEVIASFATLRERPVSFSDWCSRMGMDATGDDAEAMVNLVKASAPNVKVEETPNG